MSMLVLTRKLDEQIQIGDDITITVVRITNQSVRIGIQAPRDAAIVRSERIANASPSNPTTAERDESR